MASSSRTCHNVDDLSLLVCSVASSNETADNLPGAGRVIGNIFSCTGKGLERQLSSVAERLGFGPRATAFRIQRRRKAITTYPELPPLPGPFRAKSKKIEKDCRRLLRHISSNVALTKKQALDHITDLSAEDAYVRGLFKVMGAVDTIEPLQRNPTIWIYYGSSLQNSSRKALISLIDVEINTLALSIEAETHISVRQALFRRISAYLCDPDRSFLVFRCIRRHIKRSNVHPVWNSEVAHLLNFIDTSPCEFEWEEGVQLLACVLEYFCDRGFVLQTVHEELFCIISERTLRSADKLPRTTSSKPFQEWLKPFFDEANSADNFLRAHYLVYLLVLRVVNTNSTDNDDSDSLRINARMQNMYPNTFSRKLLSRITCPPDFILCKIAYKRQNRSFPYYSYFSYFPIGLQSAELRPLCLELARYVYSNDTVIRERARLCVSVLLYTDIYCRAAVMQAFASIGFATTPDFAIMVKETENLCKPTSSHRYEDYYFYRHCDTEGNLIHIRAAEDVCDGVRSGVREHVLRANMQDVLEIRVPRGTAFSGAGHYPLFAGCTAGGKPAYIAVARFTNNIQAYECAITEGTKPEDLRVPLYSKCRGKRMVAPDTLAVYVLRYAPAVYVESGCYSEIIGGSKEGLDATGPFSWRPVPWDEHRFSTRKEDKKEGIAVIEEEQMAKSEYSPEVEDWNSSKEECDSGGEG
ncbi:hypothetical protein M0805_009682 [Coniferiporia weirii]|nr:hypothetical protein M0805_009682 [Coniferiporia weirii]